MKIKITKCSGIGYWYRDRIGEIWDVTRIDNDKKHYEVHKGRLLISYVDFSDCEILNDNIENNTGS